MSGSSGVCREAHVTGRPRNSPRWQAARSRLASFEKCPERQPTRYGIPSHAPGQEGNEKVPRRAVCPFFNGYVAGVACGIVETHAANCRVCF